MNGEFFVISALLLGCAVYGLSVAFRLYFNQRSAKLVRVLLLTNFVIVYPISGFMHLVRTDDGSRGYFDLLKSPPDTSLMATVICVCTMIALIIGCRSTAAERHIAPIAAENVGYWLAARDRWIGLGLALFLLPIGVYSLQAILSYTQTVEVERLISLDEGRARFAYMSHWLVWGVSLAALLVIGARRRRSEWITVAVLSVAVLAIVASLRWSGGRSIILLMTFPLILSVLPRLRRSRWTFLIAGIMGMLVYIAVLTQYRSDSYAHGTGLNFISWFDWEWGRYSMVGFALEYVDNNGILWGQSLWDAVSVTLIGMANLLGLTAITPSLVTPSKIASWEIASSEYAYIVPGLTSELYMNFGLIGTTIGYYAIGRLARFIDIRSSLARNALRRFCYYYFAAIIIFRIIPTDFFSTLNYLFYSGAPVLLCLGLLAAADIFSPRQSAACETANGVSRPAVAPPRLGIS